MTRRRRPSGRPPQITTTKQDLKRSLPVACDRCGGPSTRQIAPFRVRHAECEQTDGQLVLGGSPPRTHRRGDHDTSIDAGRKSSRSRVRELVLELHRQHPDGLTDDELSILAPDQYGPTLGKRRKDLTDEGMIVATLLRRETRRGTPAIVWRILDGAR